ncbi:hypothetical protein EMCG_01264 [[Emmonsia] crescens]|uniref:Uncharacterized protein n=1 Tax=[Emmonsia] crescens TaxID=73230 RepID=A0A0G2I507_9EURO|nr:hypothetical protein EMCG_01264 [Emmonsia crescens UAMH 3008]
MKLFSPLAATLLAISTPATARIWLWEIPFHEPLNWIYGEKLGYRIIDVFDSPLGNYTDDGWLHFVEQKCIDKLCQGLLTYKVGEHAPEYRVGVTFRGPWIYARDFERNEGIWDSHAGNMVQN